MPGKDFEIQIRGQAIPYEELNLDQSWERFNIEHELTRKGIEKLVGDYRATVFAG